MANENWRPGAGKAIPTNIPIKVDPKFSTITPSNPSGYVPLSGETGPRSPYYSINNNGVVTFKSGPGPSTEPFQSDVENTLNDFASNTIGAAIGNGVSVRTSFQSDLQKQLENRAPQVGVTPSPTAPPPAAPSGISTDTVTSGPLGPLPERTFNPGKFGNFKYPSTIENGQDRVIISQYKYKRSGVIQTETQIRSNTTQKELLGTVTLPIPNDLSETNSVGWGDDSLSNAAALLMGPLTQGAQIIADPLNQNFGQLSGNVASQLRGVLTRQDVGNRVTQVLATRAAASLVGKLGINVNPEAYISRVTTAAINPNLELLFNGPKLRQFALSYKMVARSKSEASEIRKILRFFKKGMAPQRTTGEFSFYLGSPNVFRVQFKSNNGELKSIGQFKTCALLSFSANYTPDGFYAAYEDGNAGGSQPIAVIMQMGFTELTPVFNDEYSDSENSFDDVGPNTFTEDYNILNVNPTPTAARGPVQGPTPDGRTLDQVQTQQQLNRLQREAAAATIQPIPGSALN